MNQTVDYYRVLQLNFGADKDDIITAYRRLCKLYHPDINRDPTAEDRMKQINVAYSVLNDDTRREEYINSFRTRVRSKSPGSGRVWSQESGTNPGRTAEDSRAAGVMSEYFTDLLSTSFERAYWRLSNYDRQYVTMQSFCKWRTSVQKLFSMREFAIVKTEPTEMTLEDGRVVSARRHYVNIVEKNMATMAAERYQITKLTINENGMWRVFLGYRDINEIAKMFENLSARQEKGEMAKHWEEYCAETCRELDMLSLNGFIKHSEREIYRHKRYGQSITIASFKIISPQGFSTESAMADMLEAAAGVITSSLRETDIPAYIGRGVFVVLYVEMKKRYAGSITKRLGDAIREKVSAGKGPGYRVESDFLPYAGGQIKQYIDRLAKN